MPFSLREMIEKVKYSKVKLYKGVDVDLKVLINVDIINIISLLISQYMEHVT